MQEEYLHYLFKQKFFSNTLTTVKGELLEIIDRGFHNHNAGPDFLEGKVKHDDKIWAGHIEFHVKASDWNKHGHQTDRNYDNVIAHFVYEYDQPIFINDYEIPTVLLKEFIDETHYHHYLKFKKSKDWIACASQISLVDEFVIFQQKEKALINRLLRKSNIILQDINRLKGNQHHAIWLALGRVFGGKVNAETFAMLVSKIEVHHLAQLNYDQAETEAYCFGLAGFLNEHLIGDNYFDDLKKRFQYQKKLFGLEAMNVKSWKFSRMRPGNFPTIRLAQFASVIVETSFNYKSFEPSSLKSLQIELSSYWKDHYHFSRQAKKSNAGLTQSFKGLVLINAYLPFLFAQGMIVDQTELKEYAIDALLEIKAESNTIIRKWKQLNVTIKTAFDSQALIEQKNEFCIKTRCLTCTIGLELLKQKKE
jgi:hypothetical protein